MKDRLTISTRELFELIPDAESARIYFEKQLWPNGPVCTECGKGDRITVRKGGYYRCNACKWDFTVRTGTIFGRSHVPLDKWVHAMYLLLTARKGISSIQLSKELSIRQGTTWFMLQRLREACGTKLEALRGEVEIDECYIGGLEKNRHKSKKSMDGQRGHCGKSAVIGMRERGGRVKAEVLGNADRFEMQRAIANNVEAGATIHTDEHVGYQKMDSRYVHKTINHSKGEYHKDGVGTNGIESVWAVLKRGLHGVYHHASKKHLNRYVNEFSFRLNDGACDRHTIARMNSLVVATTGKRITYKDLTA